MGPGPFFDHLPMIRRRFLAAAGTVFAVSLGGCIEGGANPDGGAESPTDDDTDGTGENGTGDEDSVPVLTGYTVSDHVVSPVGERSSDMDSWALFLATREAADGHFEAAEGADAAAVRDFIEGTSFESGDRLLYVHAYAPQTCYELGLEEAPHVAANGLPFVGFRVDRTAPDDQPCGDAITSVRMLLRLSFDLDAGSTDVVEVRVSGPRDDPEEFLVEVER